MGAKGRDLKRKFLHRKRSFRTHRANPPCKQCFSCLLKSIFFLFALFAHSRTFCSTSDCEHKKRFLAQEIAFCVFGHFSGPFRHPCANLALDNGFFSVLSSLFTFYAFWGPFCGKLGSLPLNCEMRSRCSGSVVLEDF